MSIRGGVERELAGIPKFFPGFLDVEEVPDARQRIGPALTRRYPR